MTEDQFLSRRDLREAERAGRAPASVPAAEVIANSEQIQVEAPAPASGGFNFPPLTKNQLVQMGRITNTQDDSEVSTQVSNVEVAKTAVPQLATTGVVNPYAPKISVAPSVPTSEANPVAPVTYPTATPAREYEPVLAEAEEPINSQVPLFAVSPNLNIEPQTASIIIDNFEPFDNISIAISETGEMLKTGSIELPNLSTNTGEIASIMDAAQVDEAIAQDSIAGYVSTIAPLRASGVVNTAGKIGIMPSKKARGQGGGFVALTLSILMVTIGGLVLAAFMLGILK